MSAIDTISAVATRTTLIHLPCRHARTSKSVRADERSRQYIRLDLVVRRATDAQVQRLGGLGEPNLQLQCAEHDARLMLPVVAIVVLDALEAIEQNSPRDLLLDA